LRSAAERAPWRERAAPSWILGAVFLIVAVWGLGAADVVGEDEAREVGIVQDMVAGRWLWPRFNAEIIPDKPTLYHWLAAATVAVVGFSETAVRLPSAVAGAALVAWTARFGSRHLGPAAGVAAGLLLATFPAFLGRVRLARPDVLMVFLLSAALGLAFRACRDGRRSDVTASLALLGLAILAKGPVAPALYAATLLGFLAWQRELPRLRTFVTAPGLAALVLLGGGWYALGLAGWGEEFVRQHLLGRYARNLAGGLATGEAYSPDSAAYHLTFYPAHLPLVALPWTPLVVAALVRLRGICGFRAPLVRFLVCWALAPVVVFTPAEWKLRYYLLPSLPALALLSAPLAAALVSAPLERPRASRAALALAAVLLVAGAAAAWIALARPELLSRSDQTTVRTLLSALPGGRSTAAALAGATLGAAATAVALRLWGPLVAVTAALVAGWFAAAPAATDGSVASLRRFAVAARERFPADGHLAFFGLPVRSVVVYAGRPIPSLDRDPARITPGLGVIAGPRAYERLVADGRLGEPLARGEGRVGNLDDGTLVLAEGRAKTP
jgi:4-amino-4-deoxy-L-arabinose transferase-like glycosyltransferase